MAVLQRGSHADPHNPMTTTKPKMLIIGARGFLGGHLARASAQMFEVVRGDRVPTAQPGGVQIDLANRASVDSAFQSTKPGVAVLLAAVSDIDRCEKDQQLAYEVNVRGALHVAGASARNDCQLLFTSSGAVFDGLQHGYSEDDAASPISFYGRTKACAEKAVLDMLPSAAIVRIALAVGFAVTKGTNSMLDRLAESWAAGRPVALTPFEYRNPVDPSTFCTFILELIKRRAQGVFHLGAKESMSRYELGMKLAERMGYPGLVQRQEVPAPGRAPRSLDQYLLTKKIEATCGIPAPSCDQVIERCFDGAAETEI